MRPDLLVTVTLLATTITADAPTYRPAVFQDAPDPVRLAETIRADIHSGWLTADRAKLETALRLADRGIVLFPKNALLQHYKGYAVYRIVQLPQIGLSESSRTALLTQGLEALAAANRLTPMAETYILRRALMAQSITDAGSGMAMVNPMQEELAQAMRIGKENPRLWLVNGIGSFFTPAQWGGGPEIALEHLTKAETLFKTDRPGKAMPDWGRAETYAWLGIVHQKLGHKEESKLAYQEALRLEPGFGWVRDTLLPGLERGVMPFPER
jgi:tetratricopeptide (TPR) repeat protein